jgi:ferrous iron transport protein B
LAHLTADLTAQLADEPTLALYPPRWLAIKLLEADADLTQRVAHTPAGEAILAQVHAAATRIAAAYGDTADIALADARYGFVHGVAHQVTQRHTTQRYTLTTRVDRIVAHRIWGLPLFLVVMYLMFKLVVDVSAPFLDWMDGVIHGPLTRWTALLLTGVGAPPWLHALTIDGIITGVGGVLVFLPGLFVLYLFLTFLEDSGYMARVAFLMDKLMRFTGLQGKSFIPLILGFGCAVPAIYATRTLENERDRIATGLLVPLMSCSARLPVYVVFGMAFFPRHADLLITGLYLGGIVLAAVVGKLFAYTLFRNSPRTLFALELPPYRLPTLKNLWLHTWEKCKEFVQKAGTVILSMAVLLWLLTNLPLGVTSPQESYFGRAAGAIAPIFAPAGFGTWEASGALVTGFIAKEVVVSTLAQVYLGDPATPAASPDPAPATPTVGEEIGTLVTGFLRATLEAGKTLLSLIPGVHLLDDSAPADDSALSNALSQSFTPLAALAFLAFVLVYTPCVATLGAIRSEYGWKWLWVSASYQFVLAWGLAVLIYQGGRFLGWG